MADHHSLQMKTLTLTCLLVAMAVQVVSGQQPGSQLSASDNPKTAGDAFGLVKDEPGLRRVLLIGDSISIGYTLPVRRLLSGKANVHRIPENAGTRTNGLAKLSHWLGRGKWDVIHFNWGLHDVKIMPDGSRQVTLENYQANLRELVRQLRATGATLIWATSTPVPKELDQLKVKRIAADVPIYNAVARSVMDENQVAVDDLYAFALPRLTRIQYHADVHYKDEGYEELASQVAASIEAALDGKPR